MEVIDNPPNLSLACRIATAADPNLAGPRGLSQVAEKQMASPAHWATRLGPEPGTVARVESRVPALQALGRTPC